MSTASRRWVIWGAMAAIVVAGLVFAFRPQPVPVDLADVTRGPLVVTVDEEGETRIRDVFVLSAPVAGRVRRIEVEVGDAVIAERTVVAEIEPADPAFLDPRSEAQARAALSAADAAKELAEAELVEAEVELEYATTEVERARRLIRSKTISQRELDEAERRFKTARAAVDTARAALQMRGFELERARAQLMSPVQTQSAHGLCECVPLTAVVDGRILRVLRESAGVVQAGDPLVEIGDPEDLEIVADYLSSDAVKIVAGQRVIIEEWGGEGALDGRVRLVEPFGFTKVSALGIEEQRVNVIIDFTSPREDWRRLGHGYQVEIRVVLWEGEEVLKLPLTALFRHGTDWAVFVADDGRARRQVVQLGRRAELEAEVVQGLEPGDRVVLSPSDRISDGVRIRSRG
ncbi:MAG: HlyD family efflux transporter periplasmic adaptor subunit [Gammaproteobacteria bacterium]|nr:HlyD family efflux transporter periplasmic adaptor subunit [Gammaproteobacteria bacterium]